MRTLTLLLFGLIMLSGCGKDESKPSSSSNNSTPTNGTYYMNVTFDGINYSTTGTCQLTASIDIGNVCNISTYCTALPQNNFLLTISGITNNVGTHTGSAIIFSTYPTTKSYSCQGYILGTSSSVTITSAIVNPTDYIQGTFTGNLVSIDSVPPGGTPAAHTRTISGSFKIPNI